MKSFTVAFLAIGCLCSVALCANSKATPTVVFSADPDSFEVGKEFTAKCSLSGLTEDDQSAYGVTFWLTPSGGALVNNETPIAIYAMTSVGESFTGNLLVSQLTVTKGTSKYPDFTIKAKATGKEAGGKYRCGLVVTSAGATEIKSNVWNNSYAILPSMAFLLFSVFAALRFQ